jgi:hypothetical protein
MYEGYSNETCSGIIQGKAVEAVNGLLGCGERHPVDIPANGYRPAGTTAPQQSWCLLLIKICGTLALSWGGGCLTH